jgi:phosphatidylserine decarboxylase
MMAAAWVWLSQHLLPKNLISAVVYRATRSRREWLKRPLTRWFANAYGVDLAEAEHSDLERYPTFNEFFTRGLRACARPLSGDANTLVSPADGVLTEFGTTQDDRLLQAKGISYSLEELLGEQGAAVDELRGGSYFTIYLAPHNYHRVHSPLDAVLTRTRYIPGQRFSVSRATAAVIGRLFCRNERAVCWFETEHGPLAVVLVGALNVSSISTFAHGEIPSGQAQHWPETAPRAAPRGAEIGRFNMGSTVIVLLGPTPLRWSERAANGATVRMGVALGTLTNTASGA